MKKLVKFLDKLTSVRILKRKALYIVLLVVCTLFLLLDAFLLMAFRMMTRMSASDTFASLELDEDSEYGAVDGEMSIGDTLPDTEEDEAYPASEEDLYASLNGEEEFDYSVNEDVDGDYPSGGGMDQASPGGGGGEMRGVTRFLTVWLIVLIILDALWIFMLIYLRRKKNRLEEEEKQEVRRQAAEGEEVHLEPVRERERRKYSWIVWIIIVAAVVVLILALRIRASRQGLTDSETQATVYSGTVEKSDITQVLPGAGTLEEQTAVDLTLPEGVEVKRWLVSNGEEVTEGQKLALADQVTVMSAIAEVQDTIDSLDNALADLEDQTATNVIEAPAEGRVIKIYVTEGASVTDVMYEDSALMLLSLDGTMAVSVDTDGSLAVGDAVRVTLSDGSVVDGKVDSVTNKTAVITIPDDGPTLGETVSVKTESGKSVGQGQLYIHSEWKVTGFVGTVSSVSVSVGNKVSAGDTLMTLTDTEDTGAADLLLEQREKLEEDMEELFQIYEDGYICAPTDGVVSGIDSNAATDRNGAVAATDMVSRNTSVTVVRLSETGDTDEDKDRRIAELEAQVNDPESKIADLESKIADIENQLGVQSYEEIAGAIQSIEDQMESLKSEYADLEEKDADLEEKIQQLENDKKELEDELEQLKNKESGGSEQDIRLGVVDSISGNSVTVTYSYGGSGSQTVSLPGTMGLYDGSYRASVSTGELKEGDVLFLVFDPGGNVTTAICMAMSSSPEGTGNEQSMGSESEEDLLNALGEEGLESLYGDIGYDWNLDDYDLDIDDMEDFDLSDLDIGEEEILEEEALETAVEETYGVAEKTLLSITPQDEMEVTITVDETDILSLSKDQAAAVTLDAFPGQSFQGTVTAVHRVGSNSGGRSKYTADITLAREEGMLAGMNASVQIVLDTKEDVLCIPEAALVEQDGNVFVYTSYNSSDGELGGATEVTTGVSDGTDVEILSGLEEGSEYYYSYLDVVNYESASSSDL